MRIKNVLVAGLAATVVLAATNVLVGDWFARESTRVNDALRQVRLVIRDATGLLVLSQDAAAGGSPRAMRQWRAVHGNMASAMEVMAQQLGVDHPLHSTVVELSGVLATLPAQVDAIAQPDPAMNPALAAVRRETLMDHLSIETRRVSDGMFAVSEVFATQRAALTARQLEAERATSLAFVVLFLLAAWFVRRRVLQPVSLLKQTATQVQAGDLLARNGLRSADEMGVLAQTFDAMTASLQAREDSVLAAQRETASLYNTLNEHAIVSMADRNGNITHANAAFCRISGYERTELIGQDHRIVSSGVQSDAFWLDFWQTINSGQPWRGEICNRAKDGSLYWVDSMVAPMVDAHGVIEKFISIRNDITGRKASEASLHQSQAMFAAAFEKSASGMATLTPKGLWLEVNAALCNFLGYSADDLKMLTFTDVTHPEEHAIDRIQVPRLLAGEIPVYTRAKRYLHSDGEVVWGLVNVVVVRNTLDEPQYLVAQVVDITARKRAEAQLEVSNAILEESQAVAKVGGWELTLATGHLFWTEETYRIHEVSPENFDPTVDAGLGYFLPESRALIEQALKAAIEEGIPYDLELETFTTQGNRINVRTTGTPQMVDGKVVRLSGIFQDITDRKNYERSLREARAQAEHAAQSKGQFLANMSHEIRTPMNAILGLLNLLQTTELTARQRDYASKTEGAAQSLLGLLNDILDFSKVEAGKMTLETEPFRLDRLLRNLSVVLSSNVKSKTMEVLFDVDPSLPEVVAGDAMRLQQVLINLGGNAVKFTEHGQVVLALRCLGLTASTVTIEFAVQDSGIGIAPEHQAHIFSGFSQAEGSTTRRFGGTGLGLAISKRFVELMGGEVQIISALGQGSTFKFVVELGVVRDIPAELVEPPRASAEPQRVLVIDDNEIAGALTLRMVQSWGWPGEWVRSGAEALELLASAIGGNNGAWPYPVVYVDWQMAGMDGWETARRIRALARECQGAEPTIIMVTAHGRETLAQRSETEQAMLNGFLVKPVTASMLLDAVMDARGGHDQLRQLAKGRSSQRQLQGMRILVVEDNLINQQVADELLSAEGAIVSLAANGRLGVEAVAAAAPQFDVVLMDVQMPVMDGYEATRVIRTELKLLALPIIAMTANAMASDREACLAGGMNEHIGKPFDMAKLVSLLIRMTGFAATVESAQAPDAEVPVERALEDVPGLDLRTALARMSNMRGLYVRTARDFSKVLDANVIDLHECLRTGAKKDALMRLHTLKGNAGTLGATALAAQAGALEAMCKAGADADSCATGLEALGVLAQATKLSLAQAVAQLDTPAKVKAISPVVADTREAVLALHALSAMLAESDMGALQAFAQQRDTLASLAGDFFEPLEAAMQGLELDAAHATCSAWITQLEGASQPGAVAQA